MSDQIAEVKVLLGEAFNTRPVEDGTVLYFRVPDEKLEALKNLIGFKQFHEARLQDCDGSGVYLELFMMITMPWTWQLYGVPKVTIGDDTLIYLSEEVLVRA